MLKPGIYEKLIDERLRIALDALEDGRSVDQKLDDGDSHGPLADHVRDLLRKVLASTTSEHKLRDQLRLCNKIIDLLADESRIVEIGDRVDHSAAQLLEVLTTEQAVISRKSQRPRTPLSVSSLLTGNRHVDPNLVSELDKEIQSADQIEILCAFIRWSGIRILENRLTEFVHGGPHKRLRIITTSYIGATDLKAVEFLRQLPNTEVRVSYDTRRTRLHAKAYIFRRETGFGSAYVGSSNLSSAALTDGLEWNVKISQYETPHLWTKLTGSFDTYWNDSEFELYTADQKRRLQFALKEARSSSDEPIPYYFTVRPYPHQQQILDTLAADREIHQRYRNLVVAATGTGKTVVAAFDYKSAAVAWTGSHRTTRLLFVAHREEILKQSLSCFRSVLHDQNFGDLLVGGAEPTQVDHLFVSIQSFNSRGLLESLPADYYDYIVVDEVHHGPADSYRDLLSRLKPKVLLGLTATPERHDGQSVLKYFGDHISFELRLPDAINSKLLVPFQYFVVSDTVDLSRLTWRSGRYAPSDLERVFLRNDERTQHIIKTVTDKVLDVRMVRGICFCATIAHAEYMASAFLAAGISAVALTSQSDAAARSDIRRKLRERAVNFVFTVDLFNEGVDIPEVDTVLFLRPTESLTVFLQQLGRGLRLADDKECLTVLDFVGRAHKNYDFESRFRALLDNPTRSVDKEIATGFPHAPSGCSVVMERVAQEHILSNIRAALRGTPAIVSKIKRYVDDHGKVPTLSTFLAHFELRVEDVYKRDSWTNLLSRAEVGPLCSDPDNALITHGLYRMCHIDSPRYIQRLIDIIEAGKAPENELSRASLTMLHVSLWGKWAPDSLGEGLVRLAANPSFRSEVLALLRHCYDRVSIVPPPSNLPYVTPLEVHCQYTRDEILAALGYWDHQTRPEVREGVRYIPKLKTDVLFVTLNKTEKDYSPTTMYDDYAISADLFHWQTQSGTSDSSPTAQRYVNHRAVGSEVLLFVRENKLRDGIASPFHFLGPVEYVSHEGSKPMSIVWRMRIPIPAKILAYAQRLGDL